MRHSARLASLSPPCVTQPALRHSARLASLSPPCFAQPTHTYPYSLEGKHFWCYWTKKGDEDIDGVTREYCAKDGADISKSPVPLLFISFPSAKDPLWDEKHPGKSSATIVTFANFDWWKDWEHERVHARGEVYEDRKKEFGEMIWAQTVSLFPQLKDKVE